MPDLAPAVRDQPHRLAYPVNEAADLLGVSRSQLYELFSTGEVASVKIGARRLVRHEALVAYLDRLEVDHVQ
jgi:excisionase family DNA binding protein